MMSFKIDSSWTFFLIWSQSLLCLFILHGHHEVWSNSALGLRSHYFFMKLLPYHAFFLFITNLFHFISRLQSPSIPFQAFFGRPILICEVFQPFLSQFKFNKFFHHIIFVFFLVFINISFRFVLDFF